MTRDHTVANEIVNLFVHVNIFSTFTYRNVLPFTTAEVHDEGTFSYSTSFDFWKYDAEVE